MGTQHPHNTLTTPSQHPHNTLTTPSQHPHNILTTPSQHLTTSHNIKDYNRLLRKPNESNTKVFCPYCCYGYCTDRNGKRNLAEHRLRCRPHGAQRTKYLPEGENIIQFKEFEKMQKVPFCHS